MYARSEQPVADALARRSRFAVYPFITYLTVYAEPLAHCDWEKINQKIVMVTENIVDVCPFSRFSEELLEDIRMALLPPK
jgi:hypothetical protein